MTCHQLEPYIVDLGRDRAAPNADVERHLRECAACAALFDRERMLSAGLRRLAQESAGPARDLEPTLLAAFDAAWNRANARERAPIVSGLAAAGMVLAAALTWHAAETPEPTDSRPAPDVARVEAVAPPVAARRGGPADLPASRPTPVRGGRPPARVAAAAAAADFVAWPGAAAWPPFESGELIRVQLTVGGGVVEADVLVGQDGFARAVRLVQ
jgi:hypothetical protein